MYIHSPNIHDTKIMKNYGNRQRNHTIQFVNRSVTLSLFIDIMMHQFYPKVDFGEGTFAVVLTTGHEEAQLLRQA